MSLSISKNSNIFIRANAGVAAINWLLDQGARVTVTGASEKIIASLDKKIDERLKRTAKDGKSYDKARSRLKWQAGTNNKELSEDELFVSAWKKKLILVGGAYGKTTSMVWAAHLIGPDAVTAGYTPERPLMSVVDNRARFAILRESKNIKPDQRCVSVSTDCYLEYLKKNSEADFELAEFSLSRGEHSIRNLVTAVEIASLTGKKWNDIKNRIGSLPDVPQRQELIFENRKVKIVNDAAAKTSEQAIAALKRFGGPNCILITGGDGGRVSQDWADCLKENIRSTNLIFLAGKTTSDMRKRLGEYSRGVRAYESMSDALDAAYSRASKYVKAVILFSPCSRGFELLEKEFEGGQHFNALVRGKFQ